MTTHVQITTASADETFELGQKIGESIDRPMVIALTGDLGSGKTALVKGIASGLEVSPDCPVTSPSYTLVNEYEGRFRLFHVDLYRLGGSGDIHDLGMDDILAGDGIVAIEWAGRLDKEDLVPDMDINIRTTGDFDRVFTIFFYGPEPANLIEGMRNFSLQ